MSGRRVADVLELARQVVVDPSSDGVETLLAFMALAVQMSNREVDGIDARLAETAWVDMGGERRVG